VDTILEVAMEEPISDVGGDDFTMEEFKGLDIRGMNGQAIEAKEVRVE